jgi:excisionase family DNA binding protein
MQATNLPTPGNVRRTEERIEHFDLARAEHIRRDPPRNLSISEAAAYLGISPRTVRNRIADRRLTAVRLGGRVILRAADLDRDLDRLAVRAL